MKLDDMECQQYYKSREIGVSLYPMPATQVKPIKPINMQFLKDEENRKNQLLLYIHIPFCEKMCSFCPYNKILFKEDKVEEYLQCLYQEIEWYTREDYIKNSVVNAIYFGGGTPNLLTLGQLTGLLTVLREKFHFSPEIEITVEGNPHKFSRDKIQTLKNYGVNRISLGIQTFNTELGKLLEVSHSTDDAVNVIKQIQDSKIDKLSIDLMYNLPNQTMEMWMEDIRQAVEYKIDHITLFHLVLIPNTKLFNKVQNKELSVQDLTGEIRMYEAAMKYLFEAGYHQESTYDFALEHKECLYGVKHYKEQNDILGLGLGSFGQLNGFCYINDGKYDNYLAAVRGGSLPVLLMDKVEEKEKLHALLSMGLRMLEVDLDKLPEACGNVFELFSQQILILAKHNLLEVTGGKIRLTDKGKLWGNNICKEFYSEDYKQKLPAWQRMEDLAKNKK
jgi:oxygen-independent coproporphyrinogen-3 oxidase